MLMPTPRRASADQIKPHLNLKNLFVSIRAVYFRANLESTFCPKATKNLPNYISYYNLVQTNQFKSTLKIYFSLVVEVFEVVYLNVFIFLGFPR